MGRVERLESEMRGLREEVSNRRGNFDLLKEWIVDMIEDMRETLGRSKDKAPMGVDASTCTQESPPQQNMVNTESEAVTERDPNKYRKLEITLFI